MTTSDDNSNPQPSNKVKSVLTDEKAMREAIAELLKAKGPLEQLTGAVNAMRAAAADISETPEHASLLRLLRSWSSEFFNGPAIIYNMYKGRVITPDEIRKIAEMPALESERCMKAQRDGKQHAVETAIEALQSYPEELTRELANNSALLDPATKQAMETAVAAYRGAMPALAAFADMAAQFLAAAQVTVAEAPSPSVAALTTHKPRPLTKAETALQAELETFLTDTELSPWHKLVAVKQKLYKIVHTNEGKTNAAEITRLNTFSNMAESMTYNLVGDAGLHAEFVHSLEQVFVNCDTPNAPLYRDKPFREKLEQLHEMFNDESQLTKVMEYTRNYEARGMKPLGMLKMEFTGLTDKPENKLQAFARCAEDIGYWLEQHKERIPEKDAQDARLLLADYGARLDEVNAFAQKVSKYLARTKGRSTTDGTTGRG